MANWTNPRWGFAAGTALVSRGLRLRFHPGLTWGRLVAREKENCVVLRAKRQRFNVSLCEGFQCDLDVRHAFRGGVLNRLGDHRHEVVNSSLVIGQPMLPLGPSELLSSAPSPSSITIQGIPPVAFCAVFWRPRRRAPLLPRRFSKAGSRLRITRGSAEELLELRAPASPRGAKMHHDTFVFRAGLLQR